MGFRFHKSIKVLPGVRLHFSKSGASVSVGPPGAKINISPRGTMLNVGVPGTGLSYRAPIDTAASGKHQTPQPSTEARVNFAVDIGDAPAQSAEIQPNEVSYRLAALLAAAALADADPIEVKARIVGMMPERLPNRGTAVALADQILTAALGKDGSRRRGPAAIRRALELAGVGELKLVDDAVRAVRASVAVRSGYHVDRSIPVEWYREHGNLASREYDAPTVRDRVPQSVLAQLAVQQREIGIERLAATGTPSSKSFGRAVGDAIMTLIGGVIFLVLLAAVLFIVAGVLPKP